MSELTLYFTSVDPPINPTPPSDWEHFNLMQHGLLSKTPVNLGIAAVSTMGSGVANEDTLVFQGVYGPLAAQTISGTVKGQAGARELNAAVDARAQMMIRVIDAAGNARGTLLPMDTGALSSEFVVAGSGSGIENRKFPRGGVQALTPLVVMNGDYLVVSWGFRNHGTNTSGARLRMSEITSYIDSPEDETTLVGNTNYMAWIRFSQDLILADDLRTGHYRIGKFQNGIAQYTIENEILGYSQVDEGGSRTNVVMVDGNDDSWTEYDRDDLVQRDYPVNMYLDLPELKNPGEVRQRAIEELALAQRRNSPGGQVVWMPWYNKGDNIYWVDEDQNKYETRIEGLHIEWGQSEEPYQRADIDTGILVFCPPEDEEESEFLARDQFNRETEDGLGEALVGGDWDIYT